MRKLELNSCDHNLSVSGGSMRIILWVSVASAFYPSSLSVKLENVRDTNLAKFRTWGQKSVRDQIYEWSIPQSLLYSIDIDLICYIVSGISLLWWDTIITIPNDIHVLKRDGWSLSQAAYLVNRYMSCVLLFYFFTGKIFSPSPALFFYCFYRFCIYRGRFPFQGKKVHSKIGFKMLKNYSNI